MECEIKHSIKINYNLTLCWIQSIYNDNNNNNIIVRMIYYIQSLNLGDKREIVSQINIFLER